MEPDTKTDVSGACFEGADLRGADLRNVVGLTRAQLESAIIDHTTQLSDELKAALGSCRSDG